MRKKFIFVLSGLCVISFITSCGGGGGGGGSSSRGIRLIHASIEDAPLSMSSSLKPVETLQTARFAEATSYVALPKGEQYITVEGGQVSGTVSAPFKATGSEKLSLLFYRNVSNDAPAVSLIGDGAPETGQGQAAIRVVHVVAGAAALDVTIGGVESGIPFAGAGEYALVPAGAVTITAKRHVDGYMVTSQSRTLEAKRSYTLVLSGEVGYFIASSFLAG